MKPWSRWTEKAAAGGRILILEDWDREGKHRNGWYLQAMATRAFKNR